MVNRFEQGAVSKEDLDIKSEAELEEAKSLVARYQKAIEAYETLRGGSVSRESTGSEEKDRLVVERIKEKVYKKLDERGRADPISQIEDLSKFLEKEAPGFRLEVLKAFWDRKERKDSENIWTLIGIVTPGGKKIYVMPTLDSIVGPGEVHKWFDGGRHYDGTQNLQSDEVQKIATGEWNPDRKIWEPKEKGIIRTHYEQGRK